MVNHLLETSHPLSSFALRLCLSVADPSSILRTHFQVPYPASPLFATLTKTAGVWGYSSHFGTGAIRMFHLLPGPLTSMESYRLQPPTYQPPSNQIVTKTGGRGAIVNQLR